jgi:hypothetical protein
MNVLIIYDNFSSATTAVTTLQHAASRAELDAPSNIKPWRVDVLRLPVAADEALKEAADADLIVFAGPRAYQLPTWLKEWLECWAKRRQVGDAAVALIRDKTGAGQSTPAARELFSFAARHGLGFIIESDSEYTKAMPIHSTCRYWGIND